MTRQRWHRVLVVLVVALLALAVVFYALSIALAPADGRSTAGLYDGWAIFSLIGAIGVGIIDFFVRPFGGRSGDAEERAAAQDLRIREASARERAGH
jgi:hypothetical protein